MNLKPLATEKAIMDIEMNNLITFVTELKSEKKEIKTQVEEIFNVKAERVRTSIKGNKKYAYVKLKKENPALDLATKLGLI